MELFNEELVEFIFNYINEFGEYIDKEELAIAGKITKEEERLQLKFEEFVFNVLKICTKQKKYYYDNSNCFENYTLYLNYKSDQIEVFIMYGHGNYFEVNAATEGYKQELSLDLEKIV
ncbi:hypothetical protein [Clostridium butyricum]|uniref:Uncharacterized protein n=1 Tax=Clostridium butyricum E4 str. BoNT E BL5262 TaxID=632245 RepID=C4IG88_CLOBU|nr:hypothetical protein [Clostridium butyricum]EDT73860.1 hypothetical protein CBY_2658 [Clostridium butyricum 5521]EEP53282.1 hypothetical protein CLP_2100 [Clostridium butyricum E4 str. BoNT E BL5262]NFL31919.1 hypothetical protein [Clostridium butyricum]NFS19394.1 hypothetical protein [Clostridium butyricum]